MVEPVVRRCVLIRCVSALVPTPPSWPPLNQTTFTGVPFAAIPRAFASASLSGNSESASPWMSRVGAEIRFSTLEGLERASSESIADVGRPVTAAPW